MEKGSDKENGDLHENGNGVVYDLGKDEHLNGDKQDDNLTHKRAALAPHPSARLAGVAAPLDPDFLRDYM